MGEASPTFLKDDMSRETNKRNFNDGGEASRITAIMKKGDMSNFCDDSKIMDMLNNDNIFEEIDMGQLDEEEKQFILIDKDTGRVYDIRNEGLLNKLQEN